VTKEVVMSGRLYLLGVGLVLVALAFLLADWVVSTRPGITRANCSRIQPGMTLRDVEDLLGGPANFEHPLIVDDGKGRVFAFGDDGETVQRTWHDDHGMVDVSFGADGLARRAVFQRSEELTETPGPLSRLRAWLGW
jgi:hypothetical protein